MTLVKTMCMKCMGSGKIREYTAVNFVNHVDDTATADVKSVVVDCQECNGTGYIMREGETK